MQNLDNIQKKLYEEYNEDNILERWDMPRYWLYLFDWRKQSLQCDIEFITHELHNVYDQFKKETIKTKYQYLDYLVRDYLVRCNYQEYFEKVLDYRKQNEKRHAKANKLSNGSLYEFIIHEFWKESDYYPGREDDGKKLLLAIKELYEMGRTPKETYCKNTELKSYLAFWVGRSKQFFPNLHNLVWDYFELYLENCGFEQRFKKVLGQYGIKTNGGTSLLAASVSGKYWEQIERKNSSVMRDEVLSTLDIVDKLVDFGQIDAAKCNDKAARFIIDSRCKANPFQGSKFLECLDKIFAAHVRACTSLFKTLAESFKRDKEESWKIIQEYADYAEIEMEERVAREDRIDYVKMRKAFNGVAGDIHRSLEQKGQENPSKYLSDHCRALLHYMHPIMLSMAYDFAPAKEDQDIMRFMKYLIFCETKWTSAEDEIHVLLYKLDGPYFVKLKPAQSLTVDRCYKFNRYKL